MAQAIGAAPRYFGNSDAWTLMPPSVGGGQHVLRQNLAVGGDDEQVGLPAPAVAATPSGVLMLSGWKTGTPLFLGDGLHAVAGLAGGAAFLADGAIRLRHQADDLVRRCSAAASKVGSAKVPVPIMTSRMGNHQQSAADERR